MDNGFNQVIQLCYYGNHYDCVYEEKKNAIEVLSQQIVYQIINKALGLPISSGIPTKFKNISWESWSNKLNGE